MFKLFRFFKNIYLLPRRQAADRAIQDAEGYSIEMGPNGPEIYFTYFECDREASIVAQFSILNDVVIFTDSFRRWQKPFNESISDFDFTRIKNRAVRYFGCWGGKVTTDDRKLPTTEDLRRQLVADGIDYVELEGGVIQYSMDAEEFRKKGMKLK